MKFQILTSTQKVASIVSIATVPPVFSFVSFLLLTASFEAGSAYHRFSVAFVAIACSSLLPIVYVLYLKSSRKVTRYDVPIREQRTNPYLVGMLIYAVGFFILLFLGSSVYVWALMWCYTVNTFFLYLFNRWWKISAHAMGLAGPMVMMSVLFGWKVLLAVPLLFLVGWARTSLKVHTIAEVVAGAVAGAILTVIQLYLIFNYGRDFFPALLS